MFTTDYAIRSTSVLVTVFMLFTFVTGEISNWGTRSADKSKSAGDVQIQENSISCIHCASPRSVVKKDTMLEAMDQLLELRYTKYPFSVVDPNCGRRSNLSMVQHKQICKYPYCITLTFDDKEGSPLLIRGCAETFVASMFLQRADKGSCRKVHPKLDINECICRNREACSPSIASHLRVNLITTTIFIFVIILFCT